MNGITKKNLQFQFHPWLFFGSLMVAGVVFLFDWELLLEKINNDGNNNIIYI